MYEVPVFWRSLSNWQCAARLALRCLATLKIVAHFRYKLLLLKLPCSVQFLGVRAGFMGVLSFRHESWFDGSFKF